jgi:hypothetical protein
MVYIKDFKFNADPPAIEDGHTASQALYYAWEGITRFHDGVATVNLFLNRASGWMDVDSYLPHKGKVVLHNKQARSALVRMPAWLGTSPISATLNGSQEHPPRAGRYLAFERLRPGDVITLHFDVPQSPEKYTIDYIKYTVAFRGSTAIDMQPRDSGPHGYPLYLREPMKSGEASMHTVKRFAADSLIGAQVF